MVIIRSLCIIGSRRYYFTKKRKNRISWFVELETHGQHQMAGENPRERGSWGELHHPGQLRWLRCVVRMEPGTKGRKATPQTDPGSGIGHPEACETPPAWTVLDGESCVHLCADYSMILTGEANAPQDQPSRPARATPAVASVDQDGLSSCKNHQSRNRVVDVCQTLIRRPSHGSIYMYLSI